MNETMRVRAITFDAAGTLFTVREPVGVTYARYGQGHGLALSPERLEEGFRRGFAAAPPLAFSPLPPATLDRHERQWWYCIVAAAFHEAGAPPIPESLFDELFAHYASAAAWRCYDETLPVLRHLRARRYRLGLISNFDSRLSAVAAGLGIASHLDAIIPSAVVGVAKPDPAIFHVALGALGVLPREALHVGDSYTADVQGARAAGLEAVLVDRNDRPAVPPSIEVPVVSSLGELESLLSDTHS
jgi:putative hydrolase of the HAD superfamily